MTAKPSHSKYPKAALKSWGIKKRRTVALLLIGRLLLPVAIETTFRTNNTDCFACVLLYQPMIRRLR